MSYMYKTVAEVEEQIADAVKSCDEVKDFLDRKYEA